MSAELLKRLQQKLAALDHDVTADGKLSYDFSDPAVKLRAAAVLIALIDRGDDVSVLLTKRNAHLSRHAGQVSFPGGGIEPDDASPIAAALREAEEEVGLDPARVRIIGRLSTRAIGSNFAISPIVGIVTPPFELTPQPSEVQAIFEVPLHRVADKQNYQRNYFERDGKRGDFYVLADDEYYIWGATARILHELATLLASSEDELAATS